MIINNLMSTNTFNRLKNLHNNKTKSSEKLSSGLKINRASDDVAGLSISEKMRGQIRGLNQASENTQDAISLIQTAEAGMNEIHAILQRIRELAVQSSNGTYTDEDRHSMQDETTQLIAEIDNISKNTEFNTINVLDGKYNIDGKKVANGSLSEYVSKITTTGGVTETYTFDGIKYASAIIDFSNINTADDIANLIGKGVNYTCCTCSMAYSIKFVDTNPNSSRLNTSNPVMEVDVSSISDGTALVGKIIETAYGQAGAVHDPSNTLGQVTNVFSNATSFVTHYSKLASDTTKLYIYDERPGNHGDNWPKSGQGRFDLSVFGEVEKREDRFLFRNIQVGSNEGQSVKIGIPSMSAIDLSVNNLTISSQINADNAIILVDSAINKVSKGRVTLGAYQNRFEHTIKLIDNSSENLQSSESKIRDIDMAREMVVLSKNNILIQVAETMLSQANQVSGRVLGLLR